MSNEMVNLFTTMFPLGVPSGLQKSDCLLQFRRKLFDLEYNVQFHEKQKYSKSIIERSQAVPLA
jgi:hypothetical protein